MPNEIILIAAVTIDGYIARHSNEIIKWTKDLHLFKKQTMGHSIIMGSNTFKTLSKELIGREVVIISRNDNPQEIIRGISSKKCFIAGGGITNSHFYPFLTHIYITPHPYVFGDGVRLFSNQIDELELIFEKTIEVSKQAGIFQYQYKIKR